MTADRESTSAWFAASLCLARLVPAGLEATKRAGPWVLATLAERLVLPPAGVVADFGALLFGASLDPLRTPSVAATLDPELGAAMRRYEDTVLGRLAADPRLSAASFAVLRLPPALHAQAVGILTHGILARIRYDEGAEIAPGIVRTLTERTPEDAARLGFATLAESPTVRDRLIGHYTALVRAAQKARDLMGDDDLFALENLTVLASLTQRLAATDVVRAHDAVLANVPRRVPRRGVRGATVVTKLEDESAYPVGGFSGVSTSGSLENLVSSELIYMDPPSAGKGEIDLFDMRFVEGELLYYMRDEAIFVRQRRLVVMAVEFDLVRARVKDADLPWQRIVLALSLLLVWTKKLVELLGEESLSIRVVFVKDATGAAQLGEERALTELLLREWHDRGIVEVEEASWEEIGALTEAASKRGLTEVVRMTTTPGAPRPTLHRNVVFQDYVIAGMPLDAWSKSTTQLLSALL